MCGIVGVFGKIFQKEEEIFHTMLQVDTIRGPHSTGILTVPLSGQALFHKGVGTPWDLYKQPQTSGLFKHVLQGILGHNRWATIGKVNNENAHPFVHQHICGVHNGTLTNKHELDSTEATDSSSLYDHMAKHGEKETLEHVKGAFALVWWNSNDSSMNFVRNDQRPLYMAESVDGLTIFWASESWMIKVACSKKDVKIHEPVLLDVGKWLKIKWRDQKLEVIETEVTFSTPKYYSNAWYSKSEYVTGSGGGHKPGDTVKFEVVNKVSGQGYEYILGETTTDAETVKIYGAHEELKKKLLESMEFFVGRVSNVVRAAGDNESWVVIDPTSIKPFVQKKKQYFVYAGRPVKEKVWKHNTKFGCAWCSTVPDKEDAEDITWFSEKDFLCKDCSLNPDVNKFLAECI